MLRAITFDKRVGAIAVAVMLSGLLLPWMVYMEDESLLCNIHTNCAAYVKDPMLLNGALWQYLLVMRQSEMPDAWKVIFASCLPLLTGLVAVLMNLGYWGRRLTRLPLASYLTAIILGGLIIAFEWLMWLTRGIDLRYGNIFTIGVALCIETVAFIAIVRNYGYLRQEYAILRR